MGVRAVIAEANNTAAAIIICNRFAVVSFPEDFISVKGVYGIVFLIANTICAIFEGITAEFCKSSYLCPFKRMSAIRCRIAEAIIYTAFTVIRNKLIFPTGRFVYIGCIVGVTAEIDVRSKGLFCGKI